MSTAAGTAPCRSRGNARMGVSRYEFRSTWHSTPHLATCSNDYPFWWAQLRHVAPHGDSERGLQSFLANDRHPG